MGFRNSLLVADGCDVADISENKSLEKTKVIIMKKYLLIVTAALLVCCCFSSCFCMLEGCYNTVFSKKKTKQTHDLKLTEATVIDYSEVSGCSFLLQLNNGEKLEPSNLSADFKKDKLKVLIRYEVADMMSACMAGKVVSVTHIELKK